MADTEQELRGLRETIARLISNLEVWNSLYDVCKALGLHTQGNDHNLGKTAYLHKTTSNADNSTIITAAKKILHSYPGNRAKPSGRDLQCIQDALWWIESDGIQKISNVTRYNIAESLEGASFWGRLSLRDFFAPVMDLDLLPNVGDDGYLYEGLSTFAFDSLMLMFGRRSQAPPPSQVPPPSRLTVSEFLKRNGLTQWPDQRFCLLIDRIVHPEVQSPDRQGKYVDRLNSFLQQDSFELQPDGLLGGLPVYKVRRRGARVSGSPCRFGKAS